MAERLAVVWQLGALVIDDARLDAVDGAAGFHAVIDPALERQVAMAGLERAARRHQRLGHAPGLHGLDAIVALELGDERARRRRAARQRRTQGREFLAVA